MALLPFQSEPLRHGRSPGQTRHDCHLHSYPRLIQLLATAGDNFTPDHASVWQLRITDSWSSAKLLGSGVQLYGSGFLLFDGSVPGGKLGLQGPVHSAQV